MSGNHNKAVVRDFIEMWSNDNHRWEADDWSAYLRVVRPDVAIHSGAGEIEGVNGLKAAFTPMYQALPDYQANVTFVFGEGDLVGAAYSARATHQFDSLGVAPTGDEVTYRGTILCRLEDGVIAEIWSEYDTLDFMRQLGAVPGA